MINLYQGKAITTKADIWVGVHVHIHMRVPHPLLFFGVCGLLKLTVMLRIWFGQGQPISQTGFFQK